MTSTWDSSPSSSEGLSTGSSKNLNFSCATGLSLRVLERAGFILAFDPRLSRLFEVWLRFKLLLSGDFCESIVWLFGDGVRSRMRLLVLLTGCDRERGLGPPEERFGLVSVFMVREAGGSVLV